MTDISQHNREIKNNLLCWNNKPVLRKIYADYYHLIKSSISVDNKGKIIEIGSGIGSINKVIPECLRTDMFANPWIDIVEDAYDLAHKDNSVSHIILFDVFHHLQFPGKALEEFRRVLGRKGRVVIFEPYISLLGLLVFFTKSLCIGSAPLIGIKKMRICLKQITTMQPRAMLPGFFFQRGNIKNIS